MTKSHQGGGLTPRHFQLLAQVRRVAPFSCSEGCPLKAKYRCWVLELKASVKAECTYKGSKGIQGELRRVPTLAVTRSTVLRKNTGLPGSVPAGLTIFLLQPCAASRNRVWNPGPLTMAGYNLDSPFFIGNREPERAFVHAEHPMGCDMSWLLAHTSWYSGLGAGIHPGLQRAEFQLTINPSALASELAMSALAPWQPSLKWSLVSSWEIGPGLLTGTPSPLELAGRVRKGRQACHNHMWIALAWSTLSLNSKVN